MDDPRNENPYASPEAANEPVRPSVGAIASVRLRDTLQTFRTVMHVLGGVWIAIGALCAAAIGLVFSLELDMLLAIVMIVVGGLWLGLGVATCLKQIWAVWIGIVLSYLSAISNLVQLNFCALIIVIPTIILAHIALARARELRRAGISLRAKPHEVAFAKGPKIPNFDHLQFDD